MDSWHRNFVMTPQDVRAAGGELKRDICLFLSGRWRKGDLNLNFYLTEKFCVPKLNRKTHSHPHPGSPISEPLLMSCLCPYSLPTPWACDLCSSDLSDCVLPWWHLPWCLHAQKMFHWKTKLPKVDVLRTGHINHTWSTVDRAGMVKARLGRKC